MSLLSLVFICSINIFHKNSVGIYNGLEAGEKYIKNKMASIKYDEFSELE